MVLKKKWWLSVLISSSIIFYAFEDDLFIISKNLDIFASIYKELNLSYVDEINSTKLMRNGIDGMLDGLDPYTEFIPESEVEDYKLKYVNTQYGGIGAGVFYKNNKVYILSVYEGYPAQKADIRPGDELVTINNISLNNKNSEQVSLLLKGPKQTPIKIIIGRNGKLIEKNIYRAEITQPNVTYSGMLDNYIGYIKLDKFLENSSNEVRKAFADLKNQNAKSLILDLRYNGGGIVQEAVKIVNLFVNRNLVVVEQRGRNKEKSLIYKTLENPMDNKIPLIILINGRSASASEIVAGALQDLDRAVIIGQQSFGKGLVQQTSNLPYNSLIKITVAKYYTPSGRCLQAINYSNKDKDAAIANISDTTRKQFKTVNERLVYDGSGVYPDIAVKSEKYHPITKSLLMDYHFLDYASIFYQNHPKINDSKSFNLSDDEYAKFIDFLNSKEFQYDSESEEILKTFEKVAKSEKLINEVKIEYDALKSKLIDSKKSDLIRYKPEIKKILESEIIQRYHYEKGKIEQSFQYDNEVKSAIALIQEQNTISEILNGNGKYKVIGKNKSCKN